MDLFIFTGSVQGDLIALQRQLRKSLVAIYEEDVGLLAPEIEFVEVPKKGLFTLVRHLSSREPQISFARDDQHAVAVIGRLFDTSAEDIIGTLRESDRDSVIQMVAADDGCFGAMILDLTSGEIAVFSDPSGQFSLRAAVTSEGSIGISSHDITLVAAGLATPQLAPEELPLTAAIGWPLTHRTLLKDVVACRPFFTSVFARNNGSYSRKFHTKPIVFEQHPATSLAELAIHSIERRLPTTGDIVVELSSGFDSRASLAAALQVVESSRLKAFSEGPGTSIDVVMARQIAKLAGISFEPRLTVAPKTDDFLFQLSRASVATNGVLNASVLASCNEGRDDPPLPMTICGDGGEIFRGVYYPYMPFGRVMNYKAKDPVAAICSKLCRQTDRVGKNLTRALNHAVTETVRRLDPLSKSPNEVLDRFFLSERFGCWNQKLARNPATAHRISPFYSRQAISRALGTTPPMAQTNMLHVSMIERGLPSSLDLPVNGEETIRNHKSDLFNRFMYDYREFYGKVERKVRAKLGRTPAALETNRVEVLKTLVSELTQNGGDQFLSSGGLFNISKYNIDARIDIYGDGAWQELGSMRFLKIAENAYDRAQP